MLLFSDSCSAFSMGMQLFFLNLGGFLLMRLVMEFLVTPYTLRKKLAKQGIKGPSPSLVLGNIPEMKRLMAAASNEAALLAKTMPISYTDTSHLFPYFRRWTSKYGDTIVFSLGTKQFLYVTDTAIVKEIHQCKSLDLGKPSYLQKDRGPLLGKGLITTSGPLWLHQRRTIAPHLYAEKIKDMLSVMNESGNQLVKSWETEIEKAGGGSIDIKVDDDVRTFTSYIICKTMFGSNFAIGQELFPKCRALMKVLQTPTVLNGLPFLRHFPTKKNQRVWELEKQIQDMVVGAAKSEKKAKDGSISMLQVLVDGARGGHLRQSEKEFIVDNCKDLYLAAFEVTGVAALWGLMLLASHPEWQARIRKEFEEVSGGSNVLDAEMLSKMKVMRMVILEVLRLYPGVAFVSRQAMEDVQLPSIWVPKDVSIWIWIPAMHRDPQLWGKDANEFRPERFQNGVCGACKSPQSYIPFGVGIRTCPGQNLAFTEMKVLFAQILSKFKLSISSKYKHSPTLGLLLEPEHGVDLLIQKI
uniref:Cytochrome P450 n=1 Tax=Kalanchoe fedtschenkoi TaxID=63787 RepID=A0A7N0RCE8_KALFE